VGGQLWWMWVFSTSQVSVYAIQPGRGFEQAAMVLGADFAGFLVRDGWSVYRQFLQALHQTCLAHLLRRCREMILVAGKGETVFPRTVQSILQAALQLRDRREQGQISERGVAVARGRLEARLDRSLQRSYRSPRNRRLANHLIRERDALFTFLNCPGLEATNWRAEQAIRPMVVTRHRRLFKSTSRLNRIDADLRGAEDPHPPQLSAHSPSGLVRGHTGTGANLFHQRLIGRFRFVGHTLQGLTESTATHPQSEGLLQHGCRLAVGQSQTFIELRGQGQRSGAQLRSSTADRIGGLSGMPALHPPSATPTASHMNAKLNALHSWFRNLGLILAYDAPFLHSPSAMWTLLRQRHVDDLIDTPGNRPTTSPPVLASCFASRFLRVRLGIPSREGGRLTLSRSQRLFQQTSQSLVLFLQLFNLSL
jgi:hypothetical protein